MTGTQRQQVYDKTGGHCAYCGCELPSKGWHLDHIIPVYRGHDGVNPRFRGLDTVENALPACPRCNRWKSVMSVETFRGEIGAQVARLRRDSAAFRLAEDYGQVAYVLAPVVFYFESQNDRLDGQEGSEADER